MKNINFKIYALAFLFFFLWVFTYYMMTWNHDYFITVFIWAISVIWFYNTSSILFYKTLNTNDEILKYVFSFLHIVSLAFAGYMILVKIM
jgi:hypothetical protein